MPIFNKNRKASIAAGRFGKYLVYGIGEIILVVIGILIAVSINDWREQIKEQKLLTTYLNDYRNDIIVDSANIRVALDTLKSHRKYFKMVLSDSFTKTKLMKNTMTMNLVLTYNPVKLQSKGYRELMNYVNKSEIKADTLIQNIITKHEYYNELLNLTKKNIEEDVADNMRYLKREEDWIGDLFVGKLNDEVTAYFLSQDYFNRVAIHSLLVYNNLYVFLEKYQDYIRAIIPKINQRLEKISRGEV